MSTEVISSIILLSCFLVLDLYCILLYNVRYCAFFASFPFCTLITFSFSSSSTCRYCCSALHFYLGKMRCSIVFQYFTLPFRFHRDSLSLLILITLSFFSSPFSLLLLFLVSLCALAVCVTSTAGMRAGTPILRGRSRVHS